MSTLTIGLTGGLASGKSTVAGRLREAGFEVVDADALVAELYGPDQPGSRIVGDLFGPTMLRADGSVDRAALAEQVFADAEGLHRLESRVHPLVRDRFRQLAAATADVAVLEATLLVEAGFAEDFDLVVTVEAEPERRLARAVERGLTESDARARLAAQGTGTARRAAADVVIENNGTFADLHRQIDDLLRRVDRHRIERSESHE